MNRAGIQFLSGLMARESQFESLFASDERRGDNPMRQGRHQDHDFKQKIEIR
jgi:hypothetical protein